MAVALECLEAMAQVGRVATGAVRGFSHVVAVRPSRSPWCLVMLAMLLAAGVESRTAAQDAPAVPEATFRSSVELVRVAAVVRDRKGRFVTNLTAQDFEVIDAGRPRPIADFRHDRPGLSVALLLDVSGSMEGQLANAREAARHILSWLDPRADEAAVFSFDTQLDSASEFTTGLRTLPDSVTTVVPFGATSLHDAIARTAERVGTREGRRRALVVFTDGRDNASRLTPDEVSAVASVIDVPVYIVGVVAGIDNPSSDTAATADRPPLTGALSRLAAWTGGHVFVASTTAERSAAARQIVDELRHQYLIAFEPSGPPGWHALEIRARNRKLIVRARSGYVAGQSLTNW